MPLLNRFHQLAPPDRRLLLRALLAVAAIRTALWILPFEPVRRASACARTPQQPGSSVHRVTWAVRAASRFVPGATCLTQALASQSLLGRAGHASRLQIGVIKDEEGRFAAHAWVVHEERIVLGGAESIRFTPLVAWEAGQR